MWRKLRGEFYFRIPDLLVMPDQLGRTFSFQSETANVEVTLPHSNDDTSFRLSKRVDVEKFEDGHVRIEDLVVEDHDDIQAVRTLKVIVRLEQDGGDEEAWKESIYIAEQALRRFVDWVRIKTAQAAITAGPEAISPLQDSVLTDMRSGAQLPPFTTTRAFRTILLRFPPEFQRLDADASDAVGRALGWDPSTGDILLADARYALWYAVPPDIGKALVLMGSALELKAKEAARRVAVTASKKIEDAGFHRLVTDSATLLGRSLEEEEKPLFDAVVAAYRARNRVAHSGLIPEWDEAGQHLDAAGRAIAWFDGL